VEQASGKTSFGVPGIVFRVWRCREQSLWSKPPEKPCSRSGNFRVLFHGGAANKATHENIVRMFAVQIRNYKTIQEKIDMKR